MAHKAFLDIGIGDRGAYASAMKVYDDAQTWLGQNGAKYSLPASFEELDAVQLETLSGIYVCLCNWSCMLRCTDCDEGSQAQSPPANQHLSSPDGW